MSVIQELWNRRQAEMDQYSYSHYISEFMILTKEAPIIAEDILTAGVPMLDERYRLVDGCGAGDFDEAATVRHYALNRLDSGHFILTVKYSTEPLHEPLSNAPEQSITELRRLLGDDDEPELIIVDHAPH